MSLYIEKLYPYVFAVLALVGWRYFEITIPVDKAVLGSSLTLGAILTGFLATAKAIIMSSDSPVMTRMRGTGYLADLVSYLAQAVWYCLALSVISLLGSFVDSAGSLYGSVWIVVLTLSIACFVRVTGIMFKVIGHNSIG